MLTAHRNEVDVGAGALQGALVAATVAAALPAGLLTKIGIAVGNAISGDLHKAFWCELKVD